MRARGIVDVPGLTRDDGGIRVAELGRENGRESKERNEAEHTPTSYSAPATHTWGGWVRVVARGAGFQRPRGPRLRTPCDEGRAVPEDEKTKPSRRGQRANAV